MTAEPPPLAPAPDEPLVLLALAPESLIEVAVRVPPELFTPWMRTESPGWTALRATVRLLVILVAEDSLTLTMFPELSVM